VPVDQPDHVPVDLAGEDHPDHVHRLGRGHPQPGGERAGDAEAVQVRGNLRPAAVHDHRAQPGVAQEHDVLGEGRPQRLVGHGVAAVLDDGGLAVEAVQPGQGLDQRGCLGQRRRVGALPGEPGRRPGAGGRPGVLGGGRPGRGRPAVGVLSHVE
jgi:hypothetical protein